MMLILPLLTLLCAAGFCHSKAFREESLKHRSKRAYDHGQGAVRSNKNEIYFHPEVDGQQIRIPPADSSPSTYNELLDEYFKKFSYQTLSTRVPNPNDDHGDPMASKIAIKTGDRTGVDTDHELSSNKISYSDPDIKQTSNYYTPEVVDRINIKKEQESVLNYEQPIIRETVKAKLPKPKQKKKKVKTTSTPEYDNAKTSQTQPKKTKGKRRKQSQMVKKHGTTEEYETSAVDNYKQKPPVKMMGTPNLEHEKPPIKTVEKVKNKESKDSSAKTEKVVVKSKPKQPPVKETIKVETTQNEYESVEKVKTEQTQPPVKVAVKTKPVEPPVKTKEKVIVKTHSKQPPINEKVQIETNEYEDSEKVAETQPKKPPINTKEKVVVKTETKEPHVKEKVHTEYNEDEYEDAEKAIVKTKPKDTPVKEKVVVKAESKEPPVKTKEKVVVQTRGKEPPVKEKVVIKTKSKETADKEKVVVKTQQKDSPVKEKVHTEYNEGEYEDSEKVVVKTETKQPPVKEKVVVKTKPKEPPVKEKVVVKTKPKEPPVKEKVVVKTKPKEPPVKEKVVVKTKPKEPPVKEKVVVKTKPKEPPVKEKVVVKTKPKEPPVKEKVVVKTKPKEPPVLVKTQSKKPPKTEKIEINTNIDEYENPKVIEKRKFTEDTDSLSEEPKIFGDFNEEQSSETDLRDEEKNKPLNVDNFNLENSVSDAGSSEISTVIRNQDSTNTPKFLPNIEAVQKLASLNSNIWSLIFNPNAERLKLQKCMTRNNETGFCTYIQHCEVPGIATSLEQLLNNACVIDDVFIGVCCPEFPVESVKVHWEQNPPDSNARIEDEFGHDTQGELIKSWCDGYQKSLTNLLISFSLADCGIRSDEASKLQTWPWKAPLVSMSNGKIFCGGVIINDDYVLTAAHCTTKIPKNQIMVRLGQFDDMTGDDFAVVEIKRHAQYNPRTLHNDIALLKLGRRILRGTHVGVVCLPDSEDKDDDGDEDEHDGEQALLLGWKGIFGTKSKDPESLRVMTNEECGKKLGQKIPSSFLCTETRDENERSCNADSGAPLVIEDDGKYEVIGILSWNRNDCDQRFPSTFSRVSSYIGWIQKHAV